MRITLESTDTIGSWNGTEARVWRGATESGVKVLAWIPAIRAEATSDQAEFLRDLREVIPQVAPVACPRQCLCCGGFCSGRHFQGPNDHGVDPDDHFLSKSR